MDLLRHVGAARAAEFLGPTRGQRRDGPGAAARRRTTPRRRPPRRSSRRPSASARRAQRLRRRPRRLHRRHQRRPAGDVPGPRRRPGLPGRVRRAESTSRSRGTAPTSSTSPRWSAASSARAAAREFDNARWLQQLEAQFGAERPAGSSTTSRSPTTRRRRRRPAPRALRQRPGRPDPPGRRPPRPRRTDGAGHGGRRRVRRRCRSRAGARSQGGSGSGRWSSTAVRPDRPRPGARRHEQRGADGRRPHRRRPPGRRVRPADRLLRAAAAHRAGGRRPGHPGPRRLLRRHQPGRPARPRRRLRLVGHQRRQRPRRHRRRPALRARRRRRRPSSPRPTSATASACRWTATCTRSWPRRPRPRPGCPSSTASSCCAPSTGIVQLRTTVDGAPVAVVTQRSTYGRELDSALGFERLGNPDYVQDAAGFRDAVAAIDYTFNWFYVDDRDIAYYSSGRLPLRAEGVDPHLPRWGDAAVRLAGLARHRRPPAAGQPALGLPGLLEQQAGARVLRGRRPVGLRPGAPQRGAVRPDDRPGRAGRRDDRRHGRRRPGRRHRRLPRRLHAAVAARRDRRRPGAGRGDRAAAGLGRAAVPTASTRTATAPTRSRPRSRCSTSWWEPTDGSEQPGRAGPAARHPRRPGRRPAAAPRRPPAPGPGLLLERRRLVRLRAQGPRPRPGQDPGAWSQAYCGGGDLAACQEDLRTSLRAAVDRVLAAQGVSSVDELTYDKHIDDIRATTAGVVGVAPDRLAEPPDVPAGRQLHRSPAALLRAVG